MRTLVLGATNNPQRYAYLAVNNLLEHGHEVIPVGVKDAEVAGLKIITDKTIIPDVDTLTLYVSPKNQSDWYNYIVETNPRRIIFNPGTENPELKKLAEDNGIETTEACTLVLLSTNQY